MKLAASAWRFGAVGLLNTACGLAVIFVAKWAWGWADLPANAAGYAFGVLLGFTLNRRWSFAHRGSGPQAFARYLMVLAAAYLANVATLLVAIEWGVPPDFAQLAGVAPYALVGYAGSRWFAFAPARGQPAEANCL